MKLSYPLTLALAAGLLPATAAMAAPDTITGDAAALADVPFQPVPDEVFSLDLPVVSISLEDGEEPSCDLISPPDGAFGAGITNATKVPGSLTISLGDEVLYESGDYVKGESGMTLKVRGNTSAYKVKKSFKIKLQKKADLLRRGNDKKYKDKDWVLLRTGSCLNTKAGFWIGELLGQDWTPAHQYVNLVVNGTYRGLYVLCEQITDNADCRLVMDENDGYCVELDPYWWTEDISFLSRNLTPSMRYTYKYPDPDDLTDEWHDRVTADVWRIEDSIAAGDYASVIDSQSFARWLLGWDILGNSDSAGANIYVMRQDAESPLKMGPMWDFDYAFTDPDSFAAIHSRDIFYFPTLLKQEDTTFTQAYKDLWYDCGHTVIEAMRQRLADFRDSAEGAAYDRSLQIEEETGVKVDEKSWMDHFGDLDFMTTYVSDWLTARESFLDRQFQNISTGIESISTPEADSEAAYDILGRRIPAATKGLQIRAGRKIIVR